MTIDSVIWTLADLIRGINATVERKLRENAYAFGLPPVGATLPELRKWRKDVLDYAKFR